jgi:tRNA A-37 threonylcarbamoyl transferase component Bud32
MMNIEILEKFKSKRNNVYKVMIYYSGANEVAILKNYDLSGLNISETKGISAKEYIICIMKRYGIDNTNTMEKEQTNVEMLQNSDISVPKIIYKHNDSLFFEYMHGELVGDLVEKQSMGNWIDEFALWMAKLHKIKKGTNSLLKMDVNLRNFIYSKGKIYGLDFEDIGYGDIRTDLGNICFFILTDTPSFTKEKHIMMRRFLQSYEKHSGLKLKEMDKYLLKSRAEAKIRRSQRI